MGIWDFLHFGDRLSNIKCISPRVECTPGSFPLILCMRLVWANEKLADEMQVEMYVFAW